jgi:transcriptional regulator with XRE-family HTH domain
MEKTTLGQALIERRIELGIDKASAAKSIGVTRATYAAYESDSRRLSVDVLPALRAFLDVAVEDFLELYGATCVAQARVIILRDLFVSDASMTERTTPTAMLVKNVRDNEMSVVERVFFDVVTAKGHGVAPPFAVQASAAPTALRAPSSSVLGRFNDDIVFSSNDGLTKNEIERKKKSKKRASKLKEKNRKKEKGKKKDQKEKGKKKHKVKRKNKRKIKNKTKRK